MRKPSVTAGLKCPPEMCPRAVTMTARMRPWAIATPRRSPPPVITEPAPTKMRANAPTNSATDRRRFSPSTARRLEPTPDGIWADRGRLVGVELFVYSEKGGRRPSGSPSMPAVSARQAHSAVSLLQVAFLVTECNKCPPRGRKRRLTVEGSDDVGYEAERKGSSDEEAMNVRTDHAETGSRVAGVLNAAEEAAETIKDEAWRHADEILRQANADAATRVEDLTREAERVRVEADDYARDIRVAVDSYGT